MQTSNPKPMYKNLKGLPGLEELISRNSIAEFHESPETDRIQKNCFYSTIFMILINSTILPLLLYAENGLWQKIYYLALSVSL